MWPIGKRQLLRIISGGNLRPSLGFGAPREADYEAHHDQDNPCAQFQTFRVTEHSPKLVRWPHDFSVPQRVETGEHTGKKSDCGCDPPPFPWFCFGNKQPYVTPFAKMRNGFIAAPPQRNLLCQNASIPVTL